MFSNEEITHPCIHTTTGNRDAFGSRPVDFKLPDTSTLKPGLSDMLDMREGRDGITSGRADPQKS